MPKEDPRIDAYIADAASFARPILQHLRLLVHQACPAVEETVKWSFPHFDYKGIICSMAAFKSHCSFGFWKGSLMQNQLQLDKITSLQDLPPDDKIMTAIVEAVQLNEENIKLPKKPVRPSPVAAIPADLEKALSKNKAAKTTFEKFSPSHRKEYIEWILEAKTEVTRSKRIQTTLEWLTEGKSRHWKYAKG
jgi:uncharacterized protein YdeI (YjbR/CyaY-like superfamily)